MMRSLDKDKLIKMNTIQFGFLAIILSLYLSSCQNKKTSPIDAHLIGWLNSTLDSIVSENDIPTLSIAIKRGSDSTYFESFGTLKGDSSFQVDEHSIYPIGLLSKVFTGIIITNLVEEGILNYDEPISSYLSEVLADSAMKSYHNIPLKTLLYHRSGITDNDCSFYTIRDEGNTSLTEYTSSQLVNDLNQIRIDQDDKSFLYSNFGYIILGYICEQVSGKSYATLLKEYVTDEYDLQNTTIRLYGEPKPSLVSSMTSGQKEALTSTDKPEITRPADGIYSNSIDLMKLQGAQIKSYQNYFERGITNPLILTERTVGTRINDWTYGNGLMQIVSDGHKYLGYYRNSKEYASVYLFSVYPNVGITIHTHKGGPWLGESALALMDGIVDEKRMFNPVRRSLAWSLFSVIETEGIEDGIEWFNKNKGSKKYMLIESEINTVGYRLLRERNIKESIEVFKLNVMEFPESSNVYDSLGEAYMNDGNDELAIYNYQKSLDMDPENSRAERYLKRLRSEE